MSALFLSLLLSVTPVTPDGGFVVVKGQRFLAEVAQTQKEQARGLMYRQTLAKDRCMFFLYTEDGYHGIWMKDCLIRLDVVWVQSNGTVTELVENVEPCPMASRHYPDCPSYGGTALSRHFVEFPAGTIRRLGLKVGDQIGWDLRLMNGTVIRGGAPVPKGRKGSK